MLKIMISELKQNIISDFENNFSYYFYDRIIKATSKKRKAEIYTSALLLKTMLAELDIDEKTVEYDTDSNGKPYFFNIPSLYFNISHSGNYVILAISDSNIGIDIQKINTSAKNIYKRFFSEEENLFLDSLDSKDRNNKFFKIWTAKEAYLKYTGKGLRQELSSFSVIINDYRSYIKKENVILDYINDIPDYYICICHSLDEKIDYTHLI